MSKSDDLISRQAAIDALYHVDEYNGRSVEAIRHLPSAQQDCTECPEYDHTTHSCPKYCEVIRKTVEALKEAQPEIVRCKDCIMHGVCRFEQGLGVDGYCSQAERRTDEHDDILE